MIIEAAAGYAKGITKIGSTPPSCEHKCHGCTPCEAIQVPAISKTGTHHLSVNYANYEPEGWKCKCGPSFYSPWTPETCSLIDSFLLMFETMITLFLYIFFVFILVQVIFMWILTFCQFFQGQRKICNTCVVYLNTETRVTFLLTAPLPQIGLRGLQSSWLFIEWQINRNSTIKIFSITRLKKRNIIPCLFLSKSTHFK